MLGSVLVVRAGINVESRIPIVLPKEEMPQPLVNYLRTKAARKEHQIESDALPEQ